MTFSPEWDVAFRAKTHISVWPWSDLVSYVNRYAPPGEGFRRVLELGCGVGANIPFFLKLGVDYSAVEGSATAVGIIHEVYPQLLSKIKVGDFTQTIPFEGPFDLIIDRGAVTCNTTRAIAQALKTSCGLMCSGAKFVGLDWFSNDDDDALHGDQLDSHTRTNLPPGSLAAIGSVHFSDREHLTDLFATAGFHIERLEHKSTETVFPENGGKKAWWHVVAAKR